MILFLLSLVTLALAILPTILTYRNLQHFQTATIDPRWLAAASHKKVNILIPARNEEASIEASLRSIVAQTGIIFDVTVVDDSSEDRTANIVRQISERDHRVKLLTGDPLPESWNGKQHGCWQLAQQADAEWLLFLDADVRLVPQAVVRTLGEALRVEADLLSGFSKQDLGTFAEKMLIPMMYVILLGYLPFRSMRNSSDPSFAAGCGQIMLVRRSSYLACGGHKSIKSTRHDGLLLPRIFRKSDFRTDLFDASDIATCRMYQSLAQVQRGLLKNATEGVASSKLILPFSILLFGGFAAPLLFSVLFVVQLIRNGGYLSMVAGFVFCIAALLSFCPRLLIANRFGESLVVAMLNPIAVVWFLSLQWTAWVRQKLGLSIAWRGRA